MRFHLTRVSTNRKTGPIPVATASQSTCPDTCSLRGGGCYAESGPLALHWRSVDTKGVSFTAFLGLVRRLPPRQLWRYAQAGDLPEAAEDVLALAEANRRRPVLCYTHRRDIDTYRKAADLGFTINLSANTLVEADVLARTALPVVVILPSQYHRSSHETITEYRARLGGHLRLETPAGISVAICPATYSDTSCDRCQACSKVRPSGTIIGFPAHGTQQRKVDALLAASSGSAGVFWNVAHHAISSEAYG
jgi:hypothetical protein